MPDLKDLAVSPSDEKSIAQENYNNHPAAFAATSDSIDTDITYSVVREIVDDVLKKFPEGHFTKENPLRMLDYGCGEGNTLKAYAEVFKDLGIPATFVCVDKNQEHLEGTQKLARGLGIDAIEFVKADSPKELSDLEKVHLVTSYMVLLEIPTDKREDYFQGIKDLCTDDGLAVIASNSKKAYDPSLYNQENGFTYIKDPKPNVFVKRQSDGKQIIPDGTEVALTVIPREGQAYAFEGDTHTKQAEIYSILDKLGLESKQKYRPTADNLPKAALSAAELGGLSSVDKNKNSVKMYLVGNKSSKPEALRVAKLRR